jgi:hypothetical protein
MMKNTYTSHASSLLCCAIVALSFMASATASADPVAGASARSLGGPFGLGVMLGDPTGLSGKYFLSDTHALDFAAGFGFTREEGFQFQMDYLWHPHVLVTTKYFRLPWYVGVGPVVQIVSRYADKKRDDIGIGARVPFGLAFALTKVALDPFVEIAPGIEVFRHADFRIDAAIGVRYYF